MSSICAVVPLGTDVEARTIHKYLSDLGIPVCRIMSKGKYAKGISCYQADRIVPSVPSYREVSRLLKIECDGPVFKKLKHSIVTIDHHYPGDPGYGVPPQKFLIGSSLGQTISYLAKDRIVHPAWKRIKPEDQAGLAAGDIKFTIDQTEGQCVWSVVVSPVGTDGSVLAVIPKEMVFVAAADHCLYAAYHGMCSGVDPNELMEWRIDIFSRSQRIKKEVVRKQIDDSVSKLNDLASSTKEPYVYLEFEAEGNNEFRMAEAAAITGISVISRIEMSSGKYNYKYTINSPSHELIHEFMQGKIIPDLKMVYGDPMRSFGGGYR